MDRRTDLHDVLEVQKYLNPISEIENDLEFCGKGQQDLFLIE